MASLKALVVLGGHSSRLGELKHLLIWGADGEGRRTTMLEHSLEILRQALTDEVEIVLSVRETRVSWSDYRQGVSAVCVTSLTACT